MNFKHLYRSAEVQSAGDLRKSERLKSRETRKDEVHSDKTTHNVKKTLKHFV